MTNFNDIAPISIEPIPGHRVKAFVSGEDAPIYGVFHPTRARKLWIIDPETEEVIADESNIISWQHIASGAE